MHAFAPQSLLTRRALAAAFMLFAITQTSACASGRRPGSYLPIGASSWYGDSTNDGVVLLVHAKSNVAAQMAEDALRRSGYSLDSSNRDRLVLRTIPRTFGGDTSVVVSVEIIPVELPEPGASLILRGTYSVPSRRIRHAPVLERVGESNPVYAHLQSIAGLIRDARAP